MNLSVIDQPLSPISVGISDAAKMTGLSRSRIYELMNEGKLRSVHVGRRRLIPVSSLRELIGEPVPAVFA